MSMPPAISASVFSIQTTASLAFTSGAHCCHRFNSIVCILLLLLPFPLPIPWGAFANPEQPELTFEQFYQFGKNEYTLENWGDCVGFMLRALDDYRFYRDETLWCRKMCHARVPFGMGQRMEQDQDWDLTRDPTYVFMRVETSRALCLLRCRLDKFTEQRPALENVELLEEFGQRRRPFHYLQFCYWKLGQLEPAIRSAYTFLVANAEDVDTLKLYMDAVRAYDRAEWLTCVNLFQQALEHFWEALDNCRVECDDQLDWSSLERDDANADRPEWSVVLTSFHTSVLRCCRQCPTRLGVLNGRRMPHLLVSHFEYLHLCQFQLKHGRDACQSVENALVLQPRSVMMRRNKHIYMGMYGSSDRGGGSNGNGVKQADQQQQELFKPSKEVRRFIRREELEKRFVEFVDKQFRYEALLSPASSSGESAFAPPLLPDDDFPSADQFNYAKLAEPLLTALECQFLRSAADFFTVLSEQQQQTMAAPLLPIHRLLVEEELAQRIAQTYQADRPQFERLECIPNGLTGTSRCERSAIPVALDSAGCGQIVGGEHFHGCAVVFCEL